jgi:hypothetical protein
MVEQLVAEWVFRKAVDWAAETAETSVEPPVTAMAVRMVAS